MRLNLSEIINIPGGRVPFECRMDYSDMEFFGTCPVTRPVEVKGEVRNTAGVLELSAAAETALNSVCDRCMREFENPKTVHIKTTLVADAPENEENDMVLLEGDYVDIEPIIESAFILAMDTKTLCSPDCRGLCHKCGAELNKGSCGCAPETDPRLDALQKFFKD